MHRGTFTYTATITSFFPVAYNEIFAESYQKVDTLEEMRFARVMELSSVRLAMIFRVSAVRISDYSA